MVDPGSGGCLMLRDAKHTNCDQTRQFVGPHNVSNRSVFNERRVRLAVIDPQVDLVAAP